MYLSRFMRLSFLFVGVGFVYIILYMFDSVAWYSHTLCVYMCLQCNADSARFHADNACVHRIYVNNLLWTWVSNTMVTSFLLRFTSIRKWFIRTGVRIVVVFLGTVLRAWFLRNFLLNIPHNTNRHTTAAFFTAWNISCKHRKSNSLKGKKTDDQLQEQWMCYASIHNFQSRNLQNFHNSGRRVCARLYEHLCIFNK